MSNSVKISIAAVAVIAVAGLVSVGWDISRLWSENDVTAITIPSFSALALRGQAAFETGCVECHGRNAVGTDKGPPLVHKIYNPGHHGDAAFFRAVRLGTPQHHWPFGDMPPQPAVGEEDVRAIVRYIRELQIANGILYERHRM